MTMIRKGWIIIDENGVPLAKTPTKKEAERVMRAFNKKKLSAVRAEQFWDRRLGKLREIMW
jgi:hypothetical protein